MNPTVKAILTGITGAISAFVAIYLIESIGHVIYPPPENLDWNNADIVKSYVESLPIGALLFVLVGWFGGVVVGGSVVRLMMPEKTLLLTSVVAGLVEVATIMNVTMIPHPEWFGIVAWLGVPIVGGVFGYLMQPKK